MGMRIEVRPHGSPGLCRGYGDPHGYGDRSSVPTAALDSAVGMGHSAANLLSIDGTDRWKDRCLAGSKTGLRILLLLLYEEIKVA